MAGHTDDARWRYGLVAVLGGFAVLFACYLVAVLTFDTAGDAALTMSGVTGVVGALAGAYFGVQVGSAGRDDALKRADEMAQRALQFAAVADPSRALSVLRPSYRGTSAPEATIDLTQQPEPEWILPVPAEPSSEN